MDIFQLLKKDHKMVKNLFEECEALKGRAGQKKMDLVAQIRQALTVHAQVEEELVYPAFMEHRAMKEQVNEALAEHHVTKMLLAELDQLQPDDPQFDAKLKVLCEYLMHHVKEEEKEMFPQAQKRISAKRLAALGDEVETRRDELLHGNEDKSEDETEPMEDPDMADIHDMEEGKARKEARAKDQRSKRRAA